MLWHRKTNREKLESFLTDHHLMPRKQRRWPQVILVVVLVLIIFIFLALLPAAVRGQHLLVSLNSAQNRANSAWQAAQSGRWDEATNELNLLSQDLLEAKEAVNGIGPVGVLPLVKQTKVSSEQLLEVASDLVKIYSQYFTTLSAIKSEQPLSVLTELKSNKDVRPILAALAKHRDDLLQTKQQLALTQDKLNNIEINNFSGPLKDKLLMVTQLLRAGIDNTRIALPLVSNLPELLGYGREKNYLFLFQNNMELRPTGGFIGSYGLVKIKDGKITSIFTDDIYNLDKLSEGKLQVAPPEPMQQYNKLTSWYLRDANWSPDWPTSAQKIIWFFDQERANAGLPPQPLDGVIAINPDFIADILGVIGPLAAQGQLFKSENFSQDLENFVEFDYVKQNIPKNQRKSVIGVLTGLIINQLYGLPPEELLKIWLSFKNSIDKKDVLVYLTDSRLQQEFSQNNWAGEVRQGDGDYLLVVDSNFAALKTDQAIKRSLVYKVKTDADGKLVGQAEITYEHRGEHTKYLITRYRDYLRVYVPQDSWFIRAAIISSEGAKELKLGEDVKFEKDLGKSVAATFFTLEPGETKTVVFEYRLPKEVQQQYRQGLYKFSVQRQSGSGGHNFKIYLDFNHPLTAYQADFLPQSLAKSSISWETFLLKDLQFSVKF